MIHALKVVCSDCFTVATPLLEYLEHMFILSQYFFVRHPPNVTEHSLKTPSIEFLTPWSNVFLQWYQ